VSVGEALATALGSAGLFLVGCAGFWVFFGNAWPILLGVVVLAWIALYSFTKRFTALCHVFLGGSLAVSPLAAALAVRPGVYVDEVGTAAALWLLAGFVTLWVAGFDVAYALQDLGFDRERGLRSVPAAVGWSGALWVSRGLHLGAAALLAGVGVAEGRFGAVYFAGAGLVAGLLVWEHVVLTRRGLAGLPMAFFTLNGVASVVLGVFAGVDVLV
jgi:4-hydroxybenzoate polyprenyltransferase